MLAHHISDTLGKNFPVFFSLVCMQLEHFFVRSKLRKHNNLALICTKSRYDQYDKFPEITDVVCRKDPSFGEFDIARSHCPHGFESSSLKLKYSRTICGRSFWEDAERIPGLAVFLYLNSALF